MPIAHVLIWRRRASSWRPIKAARDALSLIGASSTLPRMPLAKRVLLKVNRARRSCVRASVPVVVAVDVEAKKAPRLARPRSCRGLSSEALGVRGAWAVREPTELELRRRPAKVTAWRLRYPTISCRSLGLTATNLLENHPSRAQPQRRRWRSPYPTLVDGVPSTDHCWQAPNGSHRAELATSRENVGLHQR